jgi:hypothetical protein
MRLRHVLGARMRRCHKRIGLQLARSDRRRLLGCDVGDREQGGITTGWRSRR